MYLLCVGWCFFSIFRSSDCCKCSLPENIKFASDKTTSTMQQEIHENDGEAHNYREMRVVSSSYARYNQVQPEPEKNCLYSSSNISFYIKMQLNSNKP